MSDTEKQAENQVQEHVKEDVQEKKITVSPKKKEKDPKRVAQGKRLAQISKAAKEKKMREKIEGESKVDFSVDYRSAFYVLAPSALVFTGMYLYFAQQQPKNEPPQTKNDDAKTQPAKKFVSLFD